MVAKGPADFLGSAVGESERKTVELLEACKGKVLLIDECYGLNPKRSSNTFAANVIDTIVQKVQGTPGEDIAILLAGYEEEVNALLRDANQGLARRFRPEDAFLFADYTDEQLVDIMREKARPPRRSAPTPRTGPFRRSLRPKPNPTPNPTPAPPSRGSHPGRCAPPASRSRCRPPRTPCASSRASG